MKLRFLSLVAAVALLVSCETSRTSTSTSSNPAYSNVPVLIQNGFTTQYPNASNVVWSGYDVVLVPIDWELTGWPALTTNDYVVRFDLDNQNYYAWYDANGNWIGSTSLVSNYNMLPGTFSTTLSSKYPGYTITSVQKATWKDQEAYEIKLKNNDSKVKLWVDNNGNILKEKNKD